MYITIYWFSCRVVINIFSVLSSNGSLRKVNVVMTPHYSIFMIYNHGNVLYMLILVHTRAGTINKGFIFADVIYKMILLNEAMLSKISEKVGTPDKETSTKLYLLKNAL